MGAGQCKIASWLLYRHGRHHVNADGNDAVNANAGVHMSTTWCAVSYEIYPFPVEHYHSADDLLSKRFVILRFLPMQDTLSNRF